MKFPAGTVNGRVGLSEWWIQPLGGCRDRDSGLERCQGEPRERPWPIRCGLPSAPDDLSCSIPHHARGLLLRVALSAGVILRADSRHRPRRRARTRPQGGREPPHARPLDGRRSAIAISPPEIIRAGTGCMAEQLEIYGSPDSNRRDDQTPRHASDPSSWQKTFSATS